MKDRRERLANLARRIRRAQSTITEEPRPANYQSARARREAADANLAEIRLADRAAELMEASAVHRVLAETAAVCRAELGTLPAQLVPEIHAAQGDEAAIADIMTRGIHAALVRLADRLEHGTEGA